MTYTGPWQNDALPTDRLVNIRDSSTPGKGEDSFTYGWSSLSTDQEMSTGDKMRQAWDGTGPTAPTPTPPDDPFVSGPPTTGITVAEPFFGPNAGYGPTWLTMPQPNTVSTVGTLSTARQDEIDGTPGVIDIEWESATRSEEWIEVRAYNMNPEFAGRTMPVKFVDGVSLPRWEPLFEPAGVMNARPNKGVIVPAMSGSVAVGQVTIPLAVSTAAAFAVSVVDPFTAAQDISSLVPNSYGAFFKVTLLYRYAPQRYRLIYEGDPPPAAGHVPRLRLFPRPEGGMSSAARVWPRPPTAAYGRVGPGSLV